MIPDSPLTINVASVETGNRTDIMDDLAKASYGGGDDTFGFELGKVTSDSVAAKLITTTEREISRVAQGTGDIVTETIEDTEAIPFRIDFERDLLEVFDNKSAAKSVRSRLEAVSEDIQTGTVAIDPATLAGHLGNNGLDSTVTAVRIQNYAPEPNTEGNCYLNVSDEGTSRNLLSKYDDDIGYLCVELASNGGSDQATVGVYRSGAIRVFSKLADEDGTLDAIRDPIPQVMTPADG